MMFKVFKLISIDGIHHCILSYKNAFPFPRLTKLVSCSDEVGNFFQSQVACFNLLMLNSVFLTFLLPSCSVWKVAS